MKFHHSQWICVLAGFIALARSVTPEVEPLFLAPVYIEYLTSSPEEFANQAAQLKQKVGTTNARVRVGYSAFLDIRYRRPDLNKAVDSATIQPSLDMIDLIVNRARVNQLPVHISVVSGFFHNYNTLRESAIRQDVRNAQWFSDGWIARPADVRPGMIPRSAWITPSRYARVLRQRMEEGTRIIGNHFAEIMERFPETLLSISGDSEVELSFERNDKDRIMYADYSPFAIAEFRDFLRSSRYAGDLSPASDDNHDGHTLDRDFHRDFKTWQLEYFNESGPISYDRYAAMPEKMPRAGAYFIGGGFDAPRKPQPGDPFWEVWKEFREKMIQNYLSDFSRWITADSRVPASRMYTHQIPGDFLFGGKDRRRLETSASPLETAFNQPLASAGVTVFDTWDGKRHSHTSDPEMFSRLMRSGMRWGILEYSPSVPAGGDENYYFDELRKVNSFHPSILAPFAWTTAPEQKQYQIQGTAYERALRAFVRDLSSR